MRIVFMGTPDFSVPTLDALVHSRHEVVGVYTQPDREQGRGKKIVFSPVKTYALSAGIPVFQPKNLRKQETVDALRALSPDVIVVVAYGVILRQNVLTLPVYGCINVHASLLPKYRGAAPIQWAILDGEKKTGVTIMQMDEGLDTGNILKQIECPIDPKETGESLFEKLSQLGGPALLTVLDEVEDGTVVSVPQGDSPTAYAKMLEKSMGALDLSEDAEVLERKIRALYSWPGAFMTRNGKMLKIRDAEAVVRRNKEKPGTVIEVTKQDFTVACGHYALKILSVQPEGKKWMDTGAYLRGYPMQTGEVLNG